MARCHAHRFRNSDPVRRRRLAVGVVRLADKGPSRAACRKKDWASDRRSLMLLWGVPAAAMVGSGLLEPAARGAVWTVALIWMGAACLANVRRCSRTHCRFTGP